jgi:hypothetical protein
MEKARVRLANLPQEIPNEVLQDALSPFGKVQDIQVE